MSLKHKVRICVGRPNHGTDEVIRSGQRTIRSRLLDFLFGQKVGVFVLTPSSSVETVEICDVATGGEKHG